MKPLRSIDDLRAWHRRLAARPRGEIAVRVCSTGCRALGALDVCEALEGEIGRRGLAPRVRVVRTGCHGLCAGAVTLRIDPRGLFYVGVRPDDVPEIVEKSILEGKVIPRLCWSSGRRRFSRQREIPFYSKQRRIVLRGCGTIDPRSLEDAIAHGAYLAAADAIGRRTPEEVIAEIAASGLRGRGGAGFPTARKWELCRAAAGEPKVIVCNAHEGDPGAFMDRALLEGDPHLVIEGMLIGAYAIGATRAVMYIGAEYLIAIEHAEIALARAREAGLIGPDILGTGLSLEIEIREGAGAYVCGEETALIASMEGKRGMPRPRPPFPVISGFEGKPTAINNVETWANVPRILEAGGGEYAKIGTEGSKGTKIFALAGKVRNTGLVEVPMGTTLRQIIFEIGGGIPRGRAFKAAQMAGPSGGCVPARFLDVPLDYDSVQEIGAIMGSGGLIVMDDATCMVDIARFFTEFVQDESCGKCVPCRIGTRRMRETLERFVAGQGEVGEIDELQALCEVIREASLCGLGQSAPNPVLSTIRHFRREYEAHIAWKACPAHHCKALARTPCTSACPAGVNVPEYIGLAAEGRFAEALAVIRRRNPFPSVCGRVCHHPCELFCLRGDVDAPVAIRHLERFVTDRVKEVGEPILWHGGRAGRVAVVGAGPAGLTAAYFLSIMGHDVTVFEALDVAGGMLAVGIPGFRLPRAVLDRDIAYIRRSGVKIVAARRIDSLRTLGAEGFDAVFVAVGAQRGGRLGIPGEEKEGVLDALSLLRDVARGRCADLRGRVVVVGGGDAAMDAARTAVRLGAREVTVLYRRTIEEMPASREEVDEALSEGVRFRFLVAPASIEGDSRVRAVRCIGMALGPADESGRRRPIPAPGTEQLLEADWVIAAIEQIPELDAIASEDPSIVADGKIVVDPLSCRTPIPKIFAGGDAVSGPATIVEAIAAGQRAARSIDRLLGGEGDLPPDAGFASRARSDPSQAAAVRRRIRGLPKGRRRGGFEEVRRGFSLQEACAEARRCLRCDLE